MATTTAIYGWPVPELTDDPDGPQQISDLGGAIDTTLNGTTVVGVPGAASVTLNATAWTTVASVSFTLAVAQNVEIVGWVRLLNTGATNPLIALQVCDGATHLFGIGQSDMAVTGSAVMFEIPLATPRRRIGLTAGAHTLNFQVWKDANGAVTAKQTSTFGSQDIAVTGIEASY